MWDNSPHMQSVSMSGVGQYRIHGTAVFLVASAATILLLMSPKICSAASSQLDWGDVVRDDNTGEIISDNRINIEDGGTYPVALHTLRNAYVGHSGPGFAFSGVLFRIPDPQSPTREFIEAIGGFFGFNTLSWEEPGVYELDVYEVPPPVLSNRSLYQKFL